MSDATQLQYSPESAGAESGWHWPEEGGRVVIEVRDVNDRLPMFGGGLVKVLLLSGLILVISMGLGVLFLGLLSVAVLVLIYLPFGRRRVPGDPTTSITQQSLEVDATGATFQTNTPDLATLWSERAAANSFVISSTREEAGVKQLSAGDIESIDIDEFGDGVFLVLRAGDDDIGLYLPTTLDHGEQVAGALRRVLDLSESSVAVES